MGKLRAAMWTIYAAMGGIAISIGVVCLFYRRLAVSALNLAIGGLAWAASLFMESWSQFFDSLVIAGLVVLIMWGWCTHTALVSTRRVVNDLDKNRLWHDLCKLKINTFYQTGYVLVGVLIDLFMPIFLILSFMTLIQAVTRILGVATIWQNFIQKASAVLQGAWTMSLDDLHNKLQESFELFRNIGTSNAGEMFAKEGAGLIAGTIGIGASLLLFLLKRRQNHLNAVRLIAEEVVFIVKSSFESIPYTVKNSEDLISIPHGIRLIGAGSDRELLILSSNTEHPTKLPSRLLPSSVSFYHANLSLNEIYDSITGEAFAYADDKRRRIYVEYLIEEWGKYQKESFSTLLKLYFYRKIRQWSI